MTGLSENTWGQYKSAKKHLLACQNSTGVRMCFPLGETQVMTLIGYLFNRDLQGKTVSKVLSALRTLHMVEGVPVPCLRNGLVNAVLRGKANFDEEEQRAAIKRQPVTLKVMHLLEVTLKLDKTLSEEHKKLTWAVACIAFNGCFRCGELLSSTARTIDPLNCLLRQDIYISKCRVEGIMTEILNVRLKSDKASRADTRNVVVEVFANKSRLCPVRAFKGYIASCGAGRMSCAAFRLPSGFAYRKQRFNEDLKKLLGQYLPYSRLTGHSFRIGMASLLAQAGFSDDTIQQIGRWNSQAFKTYIRLKRVTRVAVAGKVAALLE